MKQPTRTILLFFILQAAGIAVLLALYPVQAAFERVCYLTLYSVALTYVFSLLSKDYSWTDRLWSTLPIVFAWVYAKAGNFNIPALTGALLVSVWGARLTFNFARRGGYTGFEDYRWSILNKRIESRTLWQLFNLLFISLYQQVLFIAFTSPMMVLANARRTFNPLSYLAIVLFFLFLSIETIADQQQYVFQESKYNKRPRVEALSADYERGFRTSGLFAFSRHPNYLGELGIWYSIYLFCASSTPSLINLTLLGPVLLTLLFVGSTIFTEAITSSKYPAYTEYRKSVPAIIGIRAKRSNQEAV